MRAQTLLLCLQLHQATIGVDRRFIAGVCLRACLFIARFGVLHLYMLLIDQRDICFASIDEGIISVVTPTIEGQSKCRTLEELLELLDPNLFWRAHRSYVVNINHIKEVVPWFKSSYQLRMDDKKQTEIPVSRAQTKRLRELFKL